MNHREALGARYKARLLTSLVLPSKSPNSEDPGERRRVPPHLTPFGGTVVKKILAGRIREDDATSGRAVRLAQAGASPCSTPWVPRRMGLRNAHAPAAFRAAYVVWVESTYVRYTHIYVCVRIYTQTYMKETIIDTDLHI